MRLSLPIWNGRLSPVFDVAERFVVVDVVNHTVLHRSEHRFPNPRRVAHLWTLGVNVVICGAVSHELQAALSQAGIGGISEICGPTDSVIDAFLDGTLGEGPFLSPCHPGCIPGAACPREAQDTSAEDRRGTPATINTGHLASVCMII